MNRRTINSAVNHKCRGPAGILACAALALALPLAGGIARAQSSWETTPYKVRVWVAVEPAAQLPEQLAGDFCRELTCRSDATVGAVWDLDARAAPLRLRYDMIGRMDRITTRQVVAASDAANIRKLDKLILLAVRRATGGYLVSGRELDSRTQTWGRPAAVTVHQRAALPDAAFRTVVSVFSPLGQVGRPQGQKVTVRLRAGALACRDDSPALVSEGAVLRPVIRRNDRLGNPRPGGITPVDWTLLSVASRNGGRLQCDIHSGRHNPLGGRSSIRTERLALAVRPAGDVTRVVLRSAGQPRHPLAGYDILMSLPSSKESESAGSTDWQGAVTIADAPPAGEGRLRVLYVKHGRRLLARLPLVPGFQDQVEAPLKDDRIRLQAEGYIAGFLDGLTDLVSRRALLAARIARHNDAGQPDEAQRLLEDFRRLPGRDELARELAQQRKRFRSPDPQTEQQIGRLFDEALATLRRYVDPKTADKLSGHADPRFCACGDVRLRGGDGRPSIRSGLGHRLPLGSSGLERPRGFFNRPASGAVWSSTSAAAMGS